MEMLEAYYEGTMKSNTNIKIFEMTTATYLLKLKDADLISRKNPKFHKKLEFCHFGLNGSFSSKHCP